MGTVEDALKTQIKNIEADYGKPMSAWTELIRKSGLGKHSEILAMLKTKHAMAHGAANRVALISLAALAGTKEKTGAVDDPIAAMYGGTKASLLPIHEKLMGTIHKLGGPIEVAPKKGYVSLRRKKQFAMIRPATKHVDVGLILTGELVTARLESAATFNAMFTHRVRVASPKDVDKELVSWLREAHSRAG